MNEESHFKVLVFTNAFASKLLNHLQDEVDSAFIDAREITEDDFDYYADILSPFFDNLENFINSKINDMVTYEYKYLGTLAEELKSMKREQEDLQQEEKMNILNRE